MPVRLDAVDIGAQTVGPQGTTVPDKHVFTLASAETVPNLTGVYAVLDAGPDRAGAIVDVLRRSFARDSAEPIPAGEEELYLTRVLEEIFAKARDDAAPDIVLSFSTPWEIFVGSMGQGAAYEFHEGDVISWQDQIVPAPETNAPIRLGRRAMTEDDCLILMSPSVGQTVPPREVWRTIRAAESPQDAASWLAALGTGRRGLDSTALVAHFTVRRGIGAFIPEVGAIGSRTGLLFPSARIAAIVMSVMALAAIILAAVLTQPSLFHYATGSGSTNPTSGQRTTASNGAGQTSGGAQRGASSKDGRPPAPGGLHTVISGSDTVRVAWTPIPGATGYIVDVGNRTYHSRHPYLQLSNLSVTNPRWRVRALLRGGPGAWSSSVLLQIVATPGTSTPAGLVPRPGSSGSTTAPPPASEARQGTGIPRGAVHPNGTAPAGRTGSTATAPARPPQLSLLRAEIPAVL